MTPPNARYDTFQSSNGTASVTDTDPKSDTLKPNQLMNPDNTSKQTSQKIIGQRHTDPN